MRLILFSLLFFYHITTNAQEQLFDLLYQNAQSHNHSAYDMRTSAMSLPFIDDFTYYTHYPNTSLWIGSSVYINNTYSIQQPSFGIATFDGLNYKGVPYNNVAFSYGYADTLTSQPIDLSTYTLADSIYLTFMYETGGLGQTPETSDSLLVELKDDMGLWHMIWSKEGSAAMPFRVAQIPLLNAFYLHNDFQFRIRNKATLSGNNDHWNIDYVRMNSGRYYNDNVINDIALSKSPLGILHNYTAMPFKQFIVDTAAALQKPKVYVRNNALSADNCLFACEINNITTGTIDLAFPGTSKLIAGNSSDEFEYSRPTINTNATDSLLIRCKYYIDPGAATSNINNDTLITYTHINNYFAYDDGSAERTYGIYGLNSKLAYKYTTYVGDTLQYIAIHFGHMNVDVSNKLINLNIW